MQSVFDFNEEENLVLRNCELVDISAVDDDKRRIVGQEFVALVSATCDGLVEVCVSEGVAHLNVCDSILYAGCIARTFARHQEIERSV